jgi:hypothetical protein
MQATTKLAIIALAAAAVAAVTANTLRAHVGSRTHVTHQILTTEPAKSPAHADWYGAISQSFGDRFLGRGAKSRPAAPIHMFEGMKKI